MDITDRCLCTKVSAIQRFDCKANYVHGTSTLIIGYRVSPSIYHSTYTQATAGHIVIGSLRAQTVTGQQKEREGVFSTNSKCVFVSVCVYLLKDRNAVTFYPVRAKRAQGVE